MNSTNNKRIAKNVLILYIRMFFIMCITLYTSRVVLNALGIEDYGLYTAVGGFVALFGVISGSLSTAISRFITFELGKGNYIKLKLIFSSSVLIQFLIALLILVLVETVGVWFLNERMTVPEGQLTAANWVLQFSVITFAVNLISVPYTAVIIAHEKMSAFAYISIFDAVGKLLIAYLISVSPTNRLITYSILLCCLAIITRLIYNIYCQKHFEECKFVLKFDKSITKEIFSFAGWNFIGSCSGLLRDQGINILLNLFCGPAVNAGRGIAMQVSSAINTFTGSFTSALNPQITKQFAKNNYEEWSRLVYRGAKFSCFLLLIPSVPLFFESQTILSLWLSIVPPYTSIFVRLIIVYVFVETISCTLVTLMLATGNIRNYQILVGGCQMLNFPVAYCLLKLEFEPEFTIVGSIVIACICMALRLFMLHRMVRLNIAAFLSQVLVQIIIVALASTIVPIILIEEMSEGINRVCIVIFTSVIWTASMSFFLGCSSGEQKIIITQINKVKDKIYAYIQK